MHILLQLFIYTFVLFHTAKKKKKTADPTGQSFGLHLVNGALCIHLAYMPGDFPLPIPNKELNVM